MKHKSKPLPKFAVGDRVRVISCSTAEFIDQVGTIVDSESAAKGNYFAVQLEGKSFPFGFLPQELQLADMTACLQAEAFAIGDRVQHQKSDCMAGEIVRLTEEKAYVRWDGGAKSVAYRLSNLRREILASTRRIFGTFEGTVQKLNEPVGTALVNYDVPEQLQDGCDRPQQLQALIGIFALASKSGELPLECPLTQERDRLLQSELPPESAWLETCMVSAGFRQAYWRSRAPCLDGKMRRYIGKVGSPAHQRACEAVANRKRLVEVHKQLEAANNVQRT
jgi:hypothetical protein